MRKLKPICGFTAHCKIDYVERCYGWIDFKLYLIYHNFVRLGMMYDLDTYS